MGLCSEDIELMVRRPRKGSLPVTQPMPSSLASAGTPPLHRGSPYSRSLPEGSQSSHMQYSQSALRTSSASVTSPVSALLLRLCIRIIRVCKDDVCSWMRRLDATSDAQPS